MLFKANIFCRYQYPLNIALCQAKHLKEENQTSKNYIPGGKQGFSSYVIAGWCGILKYF